MARKKQYQELSEAMIIDIVSTLELTNDYKAVSKKTGLTEEQLMELVDQNRQTVFNLDRVSEETKRYAESIMKNAALTAIIDNNKEQYINSHDSLMSKIQMGKTLAINALLEKLTTLKENSAMDVVVILEKLVKIEESLNANNITPQNDGRFIPMSLRSISNTTITEAIIEVPSKEITNRKNIKL